MCIRDRSQTPTPRCQGFFRSKRKVAKVGARLDLQPGRSHIASHGGQIGHMRTSQRRNRGSFCELHGRWARNQSSTYVCFSACHSKDVLRKPCPALLVGRMLSQKRVEAIAVSHEVRLIDAEKAVQRNFEDCRSQRFFGSQCV